jgi:hypothetical protein
MAAIVSFLIGPVGRWIIIGIAALAWLSYHDGKVADRARTGYVLEAEKTAAEAKAKEEERQRKAAESSLEEFRRRLESSRAEEDRRSKELSYALAENERLRKSAGLSAADVDFILCQRSGAPSRCRGNNNRAGGSTPQPAAPAE